MQTPFTAAHFISFTRSQLKRLSLVQTSRSLFLCKILPRRLPYTGHSLNILSPFQSLYHRQQPCRSKTLWIFTTTSLRSALTWQQTGLQVRTTNRTHHQMSPLSRSTSSQTGGRHPNHQQQNTRRSLTRRLEVRPRFAPSLRVLNVHLSVHTWSR